MLYVPLHVGLPNTFFTSFISIATSILSCIRFFTSGVSSNCLINSIKSSCFCTSDVDFQVSGVIGCTINSIEPRVIELILNLANLRHKTSIWSFWIRRCSIEAAFIPINRMLISCTADVSSAMFPQNSRFKTKRK